MLRCCPRLCLLHVHVYTGSPYVLHVSYIYKSKNCVLLVQSFMYTHVHIRVCIIIFSPNTNVYNIGVKKSVHSVSPSDHKFSVLVTRRVVENVRYVVSLSQLLLLYTICVLVVHAVMCSHCRCPRSLVTSTISH